jgi:hypothetical protein
MRGFEFRLDISSENHSLLRDVNEFMSILTMFVGRDNSVGIATRYGLDGPESNPGGGEILRALPDRPWGPPVSYTVGTGSFTGVIRPGRGDDYSPHRPPRLRKE